MSRPKKYEWIIKIKEDMAKLQIITRDIEIATESGLELNYRTFPDDKEKGI